jgi:hypothetical protein
MHGWGIVCRQDGCACMGGESFVDKEGCGGQNVFRELVLQGSLKESLLLAWSCLVLSVARAKNCARCRFLWCMAMSLALKPEESRAQTSAPLAINIRITSMASDSRFTPRVPAPENQNINIHLNRNIQTCYIYMYRVQSATFNHFMRLYT